MVAETARDVLGVRKAIFASCASHVASAHACAKGERQRQQGHLHSAAIAGVKHDGMRHGEPCNP